MLISQQLLNRIKVNDPKLTSLDLSRYKLTDTDIIELGCAFDNNTTIKHLTLNHNRALSINSKKILLSIKTITHLSMYNCKLNDADIQALETNETLLFLDLGGNIIGDPGANVLAKHPKLKTLILCGNNITDIGAQSLASNNTLSDLNLLCTKLGNPGVRAFANTTTLARLYISIYRYENVFMDRDIYELFAANETLIHLQLKDYIERDGEYTRPPDEQKVELYTKIQRKINENYHNKKLASLIECYAFSYILNTRNGFDTALVKHIFSFLIDINSRKKPSINEGHLYKIASSTLPRSERFRMWKEDKGLKNLITSEITTNLLHHQSQATNEEQRPIEAARCCIIS